MKKKDLIDQFFIKFMNTAFLEVAEYLLKGTGYADEFSGCYFPDEYDEFDGVMFRYIDDEITISQDEFQQLICRKLLEFSKRHPEKRSETLKLLNDYGLKS